MTDGWGRATGPRIAPPATPAPPLVPDIVPTPDQARPRFFGDVGAIRRLLVRGSALLMVTLGLYRFWLTTDLRRYLWGHVEIAGDTLDYTGTAREMLLAFLIGLTLLLPLYLLFFVLALDSGALGDSSGPLAILTIGVLWHFALYRARRYRLARTVFRGIRCYQTGSATLYMLRAVFWYVLAVLSFGLLYPLAVTRLERYKLRHTHYGTWTGDFAGTAGGLFRAGLTLWIVVIAPLALSFVIAVSIADWGPVIAALGQGEEAMDRAFEQVGEPATVAFGFFILAAMWSVVAGFALWPVLQARIWRWWLNGLRMGPVRAQSTFATGPLYRAYLRFAGWSLVILLVVAIGMGIAATVLAIILGDEGDKTVVGEASYTALLVVGYVVAMLAVAAAWQVIVRTRLWAQSFESLTLTGLSSLDGVSGTGVEASALGEGLIDALNLGGV
jgi:uncharacterized membrane protein YjgN (DUF898 family)